MKTGLQPPSDTPFSTFSHLSGIATVPVARCRRRADGSIALFQFARPRAPRRPVSGLDSIFWIPHSMYLVFNAQTPPPITGKRSNRLASFLLSCHRRQHRSTDFSFFNSLEEVVTMF